jgi:hypothetical protein
MLTNASTCARLVRAAFIPLLLVAALGGAAGAAVHLALVKSDPANGATVAKPPKSVTLWFSQRPNVKLTRLVLANTSGDTIKTGAPAAADTAGREIRVSIDAALPPGEYAVNWRTLARDGHAVTGRFGFTVRKITVESGSSSTAPAPR